MHIAYESPRDRILWDVGHQCYPHKLVTGRRDSFHTLRKLGGISGFFGGWVDLAIQRVIEASLRTVYQARERIGACLAAKDAALPNGDDLVVMPGGDILATDSYLGVVFVLFGFLAGGWLGIGPAMVVGGVTGLARALWETPTVIHSAFTPFEYALLAGVLAWWVPGSRDVINGMEVIPDQPDSDEEMAKAVRIVLKKDPFVNGERIRVAARQSVVTLEGDAPSAPQKEMAEFDAWYVFAVDKVINRLEVRP